MSWGDGWVLLLLAVPLAALVASRRLPASRPRLRWPALQRVAISGQRIRPATVTRRRTQPLLLACIALAIVASARPLWGEREEIGYSQSREVTIALDLSRSMLTEDVPPSRLERARELAEQLLDGLHGESVGLIVFAGTAFVQVPLSPDYQIIREFLPDLGPDYMPQGGSNYASMLDAALDGFTEAADRDRYLVVLSDGESSTSGWQSRIDALIERDVHVLAFGLGTAAGGFIADPILGGYLADTNGDPIHSRLMPETLQSLANRTGGRYLNAAEVGDAAAVSNVLADTVEAGRRGRVAGEPERVEAERFQWFLLPAILAGLVGLIRELPRHPRPRQVRPVVVRAAGSRARQPRTALAAALILSLTLLVPPPSDAHFDDDAGFEVRTLFDSNPQERVRAITAHLAQHGYDAFDLRLLVEETIRYGADADRTGTPVEAGVIRDAIEASVRGEQLDDAIADWSYYRAQLDDLLETAAASGTDDAADEERKPLMDEEDSQPVVAGQSTQAANDSFGRGASARSDNVLGDLSSSRDITVEGRRKQPPGAAGRGGVSAPQSAGADDDPILAFSRERLETVVRRDSPGRLHQLLVEDSAAQNSNRFEW